MTDLKLIFELLLVILIWLEENIPLKYLLIDGVDVCQPHAQTVSTSLMPRLVNLDKLSLNKQDGTEGNYVFVGVGKFHEKAFY